jgi:DNA-binding winged helix-turn-helix (wHTH) protein
MTPNIVAAINSESEERPKLATVPASRFLRFGPFVVDQQRQEVTKNGVRLKLQGKVYQVLIALLEKPGEVVTREELRQRLWPADTHVNYDANVNTTVNKLRQVLGDSSDNPIFIETVPRRGYCLVAHPERTEASPAPALAEVSEISKSPEPGFSARLPVIPSEPLTRRSGFWVPLGVVGLLLAGMLLGAGITITTLWISHFAQLSRWP